MWLCSIGCKIGSVKFVPDLPYKQVSMTLPGESCFYKYFGPDLEEAAQCLRAHPVEDGAVEDDGDDCSDGGDDHGHDEHATHASGLRDRVTRHENSHATFVMPSHLAHLVSLVASANAFCLSRLVLEPSALLRSEK